MIAHTQQLYNFDDHAIFFKELTSNRFGELFAKGYLSSRKLPGPSFIAGAWPSFSQEDLSFLIEDHCSNANTYIVASCFHGCYPHLYGCYVLCWLLMCFTDLA